MKWTKRQPKVSGYYWVRLPAFDRGHGLPTIAKVYVSTDSSNPHANYSVCGNEHYADLPLLSLWAGPIPPPKA